MWTNTTQQLVQGVMRHGPDILEHCQTSDDLTQYISRLHQEHLKLSNTPTASRYYKLVYTLRI
jgi:hypothetical protein